MIHHTCPCGEAITLSETQDYDQLRCPNCGMSIALGQESFGVEIDVESITRSELLALSKSTSNVFKGIRAFRVGVTCMILCTFLVALAKICEAYDVDANVVKLVKFASYGLMIPITILALLGWYHLSKVAPSGLKARRSLLLPLLLTSKFGFWILFFIPVAGGFFAAETWMNGAGIWGRVGLALFVPGFALPALLTLSIFQIKNFLASWRNEKISLAATFIAMVVTFLLTLVAILPIVGFLISVVVGLYWNRQLASIGNESLILLTRLNKVTQG